MMMWFSVDVRYNTSLGQSIAIELVRGLEYPRIGPGNAATRVENSYPGTRLSETYINITS